MLRSTQFSTQYLELIHRVTGGQTITVECSLTQARRLRLSFYKLRMALRAEGRPEADSADTIQVSILNEEPCKVVFSNRDTLPDAQLLAEAFNRNNGHAKENNGQD